MSDSDRELHKALSESVRGALTPAEIRIERTDRLVERLSEESGMEGRQNYLPVDIAAEGEVVGIWPDGTPMEVFTYWTRETEG